MPQQPADNSIIWAAKSWEEIKRLASTEQVGDLALLVRKFGRSGVLSANTEEDVWESGGAKTLLTSAQTLDVVSTSASDTLAGTGARFVQIGGLDADYNLISEVVQMNGTSAVTTSTEFLRVNRARVVTSGSSTFNVGVISITSTDTADNQGTIPTQESITQQSHFTVPNGYTAFTTGTVFSVYRSSGGSGVKEAEIDQMVYVPDINTRYRSIRIGLRSDGGSHISSPEVPSQTPAKSTLWYTANASSNGTVVTTIQEIVLLKGDFNLRTEI